MSRFFALRIFCSCVGKPSSTAAHEVLCCSPHLHALTVLRSLIYALQRRPPPRRRRARRARLRRRRRRRRPRPRRSGRRRRSRCVCCEWAQRRGGRHAAAAGLLCWPAHAAFSCAHLLACRPSCCAVQQVLAGVWQECEDGHHRGPLQPVSSVFRDICTACRMFCVAVVQSEQQLALPASSLLPPYMQLLPPPVAAAAPLRPLLAFSAFFLLLFAAAAACCSCCASTPASRPTS